MFNHVTATPFEKKISRGEFVYRAGDEAKRLYLVKSGLVGLVLYGPTGNEHLLRLFKPGDYFGHRALFSNDTYHANAVALEPTEVAFIDRETVYENLRKDPEVAINIIQVLARQLRQAEERLAAVTDKDVRARVAEALIYLKERYPEHRWTRKEIADFCSSTTATVIKTLAQFEDEGLIAQDGRNIQILKRSHLLAMSN